LKYTFWSFCAKNPHQVSPSILLEEIRSDSHKLLRRRFQKLGMSGLPFERHHKEPLRLTLFIKVHPVYRARIEDALPDVLELVDMAEGHIVEAGEVLGVEDRVVLQHLGIFRPLVPLRLLYAP